MWWASERISIETGIEIFTKKTEIERIFAMLSVKVTGKPILLLIPISNYCITLFW